MAVGCMSAAPAPPCRHAMQCRPWKQQPPSRSLTPSACTAAVSSSLQPYKACVACNAPGFLASLASPSWGACSCLEPALRACLATWTRMSSTKEHSLSICSINHVCHTYTSQSDNWLNQRLPKRYAQVLLQREQQCSIKEVLCHGQEPGSQLRAAGACLGQVLCEVLAHEVEERGLLAGRRPHGRPLPQRLPAASASKFRISCTVRPFSWRHRIFMTFVLVHMGVFAMTMIRGGVLLTCRLLGAQQSRSLPEPPSRGQHQAPRERVAAQ